MQLSIILPILALPLMDVPLDDPKPGATLMTWDCGYSMVTVDQREGQPLFNLEQQSEVRSTTFTPNDAGAMQLTAHLTSAPVSRRNCRPKQLDVRPDPVRLCKTRTESAVNSAEAGMTALFKFEICGDEAGRARD